MPAATAYKLPSCNVLTGRGGAGGSVRHVQRRVELTLRLGRGEAGPGFGTAAPHDLPAAVLRLQGFRGEGDDVRGGGAREKHVHAPGPCAVLKLGEQRVTVTRARRGQRCRVDDHETRRHVGEPAAERNDQGL